jgi:hypothetical protein
VAETLSGAEEPALTTFGHLRWGQLPSATFAGLTAFGRLRWGQLPWATVGPIAFGLIPSRIVNGLGNPVRFWLRNYLM